MGLLLGLPLKFCCEDLGDKAQHLVYNELPVYANSFFINIITGLLEIIGNRGKVASTVPDASSVATMLVPTPFFVQANVRDTGDSH